MLRRVEGARMQAWGAEAPCLGVRGGPGVRHMCCAHISMCCAHISTLPGSAGRALAPSTARPARSLLLFRSLKVVKVLWARSHAPPPPQFQNDRPAKPFAGLCLEASRLYDHQAHQDHGMQGLTQRWRPGWLLKVGTSCTRALSLALSLVGFDNEASSRGVSRPELAVATFARWSSSSLAG